MKTIKILLPVFILSISLKLNAQEQPITLQTPTGEIKGILSMPPGSTKVPVVLLLAGSGPTDRDGNQPGMQNNSLKLLAEALAKNNIASVRFDKRGVGESAAAAVSERDLRLETYIEDARHWINMLTEDKRFSKVIIAGHSEGSLIGLLASINNPELKGYISIAGAGRSADLILKEQLQTQVQMVKDMVLPMIDTLKRGDTLVNVPAMLYSLFRPTVQPYIISWFKYDPQTEIKKLTIPVLILQGDKDLQVQVADADLLAAANPKAKKKIIPNMNHVLKDTKSTDIQQQMATYQNSELPLNIELVNEIVGFINKLK